MSSGPPIPIISEEKIREVLRHRHVSEMFESKPIMLFYAREMESIARQVVIDSKGSIILGSCTWDNFADGFPNLFINDASELYQYHVAFLACFHDPATLFAQVSMVRTCFREYELTLGGRFTACQSILPRH
jgi:hypothetical protein